MTEEFFPYIPASRMDMKEMTLKAAIVGLILAAIMAAANAYFGLYVGMTVSAAIPAAVISTAVLRPFKGTVLEINVAETFAAAGEALAAGVIFTIPALLILWKATEGQAGWSTLQGPGQLGVIFFVAFIGGMLGVLFTIPLRKILIVDLNLKYPEGVACAEVIKVGERGGAGIKAILIAGVLGIVFKLAASEFAFNLFKERFLIVVPDTFTKGDSPVKVPFGLNVSPALAAVGYIIGLPATLMVAAGGFIGWVVLIPIVGAVYGWNGLTGEDAVFYIWRKYTMYVGIGAIVVGGISTLYKMRHNMVKGVKESFRAASGMGGPAKIRTDTDFPFKKIYFIIIPIAMATFYFFFFYVQDLLPWYAGLIVSIVLAVVLFLCAFLFTAVAGYIAGVLGSSNNPISGVTVITLLFTAIMLKGMSYIPMGLTNWVGMTATIVVAGIVCCSAAIAGDCMQNMKVGHILGSTPKWLQVAEFGGVIITAFVMGFVLMFLDNVYGIGNPKTLPAPQAYVMAGVVQGVFTLDVPWLMLGLGVAVAVTILIMQKLKIAQISIMAVAIGIYLPVTLSLPILFGGLINHFSNKYIEKKVKMDHGGKPDVEDRVKKAKEAAESDGVLFCSGLIAGEALTGVIIAVMVIAAGATFFNILGEASMWPGLLVFGYLLVLMFYMIVRKVAIGETK